MGQNNGGQKNSHPGATADPPDVLARCSGGGAVPLVSDPHRCCEVQGTPLGLQPWQNQTVSEGKELVIGKGSAISTPKNTYFLAII